MLKSIGIVVITPFQKKLKVKSSDKMILSEKWNHGQIKNGK